MVDTHELRQQASKLLSEINRIEIENAGAIKTREKLEQTILELKNRAENDKEALDIATHAIEILRQVSDEAVSKAYEFLEINLNAALERMFTNTTRRIKIKEYTRSGQYPQLELELEVGNGIKRSLKTDSGHGLAQIVSLLSILSLIVITHSRRILVMDEVISGLSVHNRKIVTDILWSFTEIGFQFIVNDHGFIPEGSHVYHLEMVGNVSGVKQHYIAKKGVYLQGDGKKEYNYSENNTVDNSIEQKDIDSNNEENANDSEIVNTINIPNKPDLIPANNIISI